MQEAVMEDVKKGQDKGQKPVQKEDVLSKGGALSDAELGQVAGGVKSITEFNPQPDPPGRQ